MNVARALVIVLAGATFAHAQRVDVVLPDTIYQRIDNFGASDCWTMQKLAGWSLASRERVADLLFSPTKGIGLSCWRFNIGGGVNPRIKHPWRSPETFETAEGQYDWTRQAGERWFLAAAKARGVPQFLAFVNSPPGRMTRNGLTFTTKGDGSTNLKAGFEAQYARYLGDILDHFRTNTDARERVEFQYISPVNEPQWQWDGTSQEGNRASNADIKAVTRALSSELRRRRLATQIALIESGSLPDMVRPNAEMTKQYGSPYGNYIDDFLGDGEIAPLLGPLFGYHSYGSDLLNGPIVTDRQALAERMRRYPERRLWQTEYCILVGPEGKGGNKRDLSMDTALVVARIIHLDMAVANASAWQWWTAMSPEDYKDGLIYTDYQKPGDAESILPSRLLWALGNYSRFVRPGMHRVAVQGDPDDIRGLMRTAYVDSDTRKIAVVYVNEAEAAQGVTVNFNVAQRGWHLRRMTPWVTSSREGDELKAYPPVKDRAAFQIPGRSVVTFVAEFDAARR
ncbi:glycoside hydrolase [uncultured Paludibaculum sp.]|uniref:glycoside hydrolase n=1 Tax=uncultured Paludibaculum sp. TaxID=1765020 RepID=UPI002AAB3BDA|nr:glycoside hydrolase [uncultured Paludibaculum sp.]